MMRVLEKPEMDFLREEVQEYEQEHGMVVQELPDLVASGCQNTCYASCQGTCWTDCSGSCKGRSY